MKEIDLMEKPRILKKRSPPSPKLSVELVGGLIEFHVKRYAKARMGISNCKTIANVKTRPTGFFLVRQIITAKP